MQIVLIRPSGPYKGFIRPLEALLYPDSPPLGTIRVAQPSPLSKSGSGLGGVLELGLILAVLAVMVITGLNIRMTW